MSGTGNYAPYLDGTKNLTFSNNTYYAANPTTGTYFFFGTSGNDKTFAQWQTLPYPQDVGSTISLPNVGTKGGKISNFAATTSANGDATSAAT